MPYTSFLDYFNDIMLLLCFWGGNTHESYNLATSYFDLRELSQLFVRKCHITFHYEFVANSLNYLQNQSINKK
jgi:hypothetical protein